MKKVLLLLVAFTYTVIAAAQAPVFAWVKKAETLSVALIYVVTVETESTVFRQKFIKQ